MTSIVVSLVRILGSHPIESGSTPGNGKITINCRDIASIIYLVIKALKSSRRYYLSYLRNVVLNIVQK